MRVKKQVGENRGAGARNKAREEKAGGRKKVHSKRQPEEGGGRARKDTVNGFEGGGAGQRGGNALAGGPSLRRPEGEVVAGPGGGEVGRDGDSGAVAVRNAPRVRLSMEERVWGAFLDADRPKPCEKVCALPKLIRGHV